MKPSLFLFVLLTSVAFLFAMSWNKDSCPEIKAGDISFMTFKANGNDGFSIITFRPIKPNTKIFFADSEWNGNHFGTDEGTLIWNSGNETIKAGSNISFGTLNSIPFVSHGQVKGEISISTSSDAIFAFKGTGVKMPTQFLAAFANDRAAYGTLLNTGLVEGHTAITFPKGTYLAQYNGPKYNINKDDFIMGLNEMKNYNFNQDGLVKSDTSITDSL
ncbi:MAG: hypothetical protein AAFZ89_09760 [Bacteroidota bacterium]